jgi:hypothetical protein
MEQSIKIERRFAIIDEWLLDLDISDRAIRLYAVLARYADNDTHKAYPSRETLAQRLRCSKASVDRAAQELVDCHAMTKKQRHNSSIVYTLQVSSPMTRGVLTHDEGGSSPVQRGVLTSDDLTRTTELEPKERELLNSQFDQFWSVYPKKNDKATAKRSFEKALKRVSIDEIIAGAERYRDDPNREQAFTKNPSTWLNADAWGNEPLPVRGRKLTNAENAALLAQKYREREQTKAIEAPDVDFSAMLKGVQ